MPRNPSSGARHAPVLTRRALNRALLARQHLLVRTEMTPAALVEHLVGLQAQVPSNPYVALWSRLDPFDPESLSALIAGREAVRVSLYRATLHLLTAADYLALRPLFQPVLERILRGSSPWARRAAGIDEAALLAAAGRWLEEQPRTLASLRTLIAAEWPDADSEALAQVAHYLLPLVQVPPRGLWNASGQATWATVEAWLGRPLGPASTLEALTLRYLAAFGPATPRDAQAWSGLTGLAPIFESLRPRLATFTDENGRELFDLPDAPRPDAGTPAPPRFLPEYDNVFLAHADRARIVDEADRKRLLVTNGLPSSLLIDGFGAATWKLTITAGAATLLIQPFAPLSPDDTAAVTAEGEQLIDFLAPESTPREIRFVS